MVKVKPSLRSTETYTESNFLRLHTTEILNETALWLITIEHLSYSPGQEEDSGKRGWSCQTIVDAETMSKEDALFIAKSYARENGIPVIYECHSE